MLEPVCASLGYDIPNIVFIDLITVHLPKARWFTDCKGDKFYVSPDFTTIPTTKAAQSYSDEANQALEAAGFKVMKLVLSKNVHECYKLAKCQNANLPYLATHPCIAWANSITLRGSIADIQEFYATRAVHENPDKYLNLNAALQLLNFDAAQNKSLMIEWLKETLDIDYQALSIKSFVHMQHELCVEIYALLCQRSDCQKIAKAKVLFTSRRWYSKDTKNCEHGMVRCLCEQCVPFDVSNKPCEVEGCKVQPSFNQPGIRPAIRCDAHRLEGMVDVVNKTCEAEGCKVQPSFNQPGIRPAIRCDAHRLEGMVNVVNKTCEACDTSRSLAKCCVK